jgi:hypothetical protein
MKYEQTANIMQTVKELVAANVSRNPYNGYENYVGYFETFRSEDMESFYFFNGKDLYCTRNIGDYVHKAVKNSEQTRVFIKNDDRGSLTSMSIAIDGLPRELFDFHELFTFTNLEEIEEQDDFCRESFYNYLGFILEMSFFPK